MAWVLFLCIFWGGDISSAYAQVRPIQPKDMATNMLQFLTDDQIQDAAAIASELVYRYPQSREGSEALYVLGVVASRKGQFGEARRFLGEYVERGGLTTYHVRAKRLLRLLVKDDYGGRPLTLYLESERCLEESRSLKSLRLLKQCLAEYPNAGIAADALNSLAYVYLVSLKDYGEAAKAYEKLRETHPDDSYTDNAIYGLGRSMELLGRKQAAREYYLSLKKRHAALGTEIGGYSIPALNEYSRVWHRRASLGLNRLEAVSVKPGKGEGADFFLTGFGDRLVAESPAGSSKFHRLWKLLEQDKVPVRFIEFTLNSKVRVTWDNRQEILSAASLGYAPVVIFQYFDEDLSPDFVRQNAEKYYSFIRERLAPLLRGIHEPYILLEAEFNRGGVENWAGWNAVAIKAIRIIRDELPSAKIGLTVGDWNFTGRERLKESMGEVAPHCDFLGYQFMISSIEEAWVQDPSGQLLDRVLDFADYLSKTFNRPLLIGYLGISSLDGWAQVQAECLKSFFRHRYDLMHMGVFGMVYFSYVDDPNKSGWFGPAERLFGIVDSEGVRKPAWSVYSTNAQILMNEEAELAGERPSLACPSQASPSRETPLELTYEFRRPRFWRLMIRGQESGALRTYQGFSRTVRVQWEGDADKGRFTAEACHVDLSVITGRSDGSALRLARCELSVTGLASAHRKVLFSEGRASEFLASSSFIQRASKVYSGLRTIQLDWSDSMGGMAFSMSLNKPLFIQVGDALVLRFKGDLVESAHCWVSVLTDQGDVPFSITPYLYRDAGKGWKTIRISREEIEQGLLWKYGKRFEQIHISGLQFTNLSSGRLLVDDVFLETTHTVEPEKVIPYISLPTGVPEPANSMEHPGKKIFFRHQ